MASTAKLESKLGQQPQEVLKCPRCNSSNTKFCYYNNYSLSQPRHFCKSCKRYWTRGGTLRNVPVGGRCRKNKHFKRPPYPSFSSSSATSNTYSYNTHQIDTYSDGALPFPSFDSIISSGYYDFLQPGQLGVLGLGSPSASTPAMASFLASSFQQQSFINGGHIGMKGEAADTMKQVKLEGGQMEVLGSATDPSVMYCVNAWRGGLSNINSSVTSLI